MINDADKFSLVGTPYRLGRPPGRGRFGDYRTAARLLGVNASYLHGILSGSRPSPALLARYHALKASAVPAVTCGCGPAAISLSPSSEPQLQ